MAEDQKNDIEIIKSELTEKNATTALDEYDMVIQPIEVPSPEWLETNQYKLLSPERVGQVSALFQGIPGLITNQATINAANEATRAMADGAYKAILKDGMHLAKSTETSGTFRGLLFTNDGNHLGGHAELTPLQSVEFSQTPQIVLGAFTALSIVTNQFFLSQINSNLQGIKAGISDIQFHLETAERNKLLAIEDRASSFIRNGETIHKNERLKANASANLGPMITEVQGICWNYADKCENAVNKLSSKPKRKKIKETAKTVSYYFSMYRLAIHLYGVLSFLEAVLADEASPEFLDNICGNIRVLQDKYSGDLSACEKALLIAFDKNLVYEITEESEDDFDDFSVLDLDEDITVSGMFSSILFDEVRKGAAHKISAPFQKAKEKDKEWLISLLANYHNMGSIEDLLGRIQFYKDQNNGPAEFIKVNERVYYKLGTTTFAASSANASMMSALGEILYREFNRV